MSAEEKPSDAGYFFDCRPDDAWGAAVFAGGGAGFAACAALAKSFRGRTKLDPKA